MTRTELAIEIHENSVAKGFWDDESLSANHYMMLVITELSEAVEADRKGKRAKKTEYEDLPNKQIGHEMYLKDTLEDELADAYIRLLDLSEGKFFRQNKDKFTMLDKMAVDRYWRDYSFTENILFIVMSVTYISDLGYSASINFGLTAIEQLCKSMDIDLEFYVMQKMCYNSLRPKLHGKKY